MRTLIEKLFHWHRWETVAYNRFYHPTAQQCKCGLYREVQFRPNHKQIKGMPWDKVWWVYSDGTTKEYDVLD